MTLLKSVSIILVADVAIRFAGYVLLPLYLQLMPKTEFGEFIYIYSLVTLAAPLLALGIYVPQIRDYSSAKSDHRKKIILNSAIATVLSVQFFWISITIATPYLKEILVNGFELGVNSENYLIYILLLLGLWSINLILYSNAISEKKTGSIVKFNATRFLISNACALMYIYFREVGVNTATIRVQGILSGEMALLFFSLIQIRSSLSTKYIKKYMMKRLVAGGLKILPASCVQFVIGFVERGIIVDHAGKDGIAEYLLAMQLTAPIAMLMASFQSIYAPKIYEIRSDDKANSELKFNFARGSLIYTGLIISIIILAWALRFLNLITVEYDNVVLLTAVLGTSVALQSMNQLIYNILIRRKKEIYVSISYLGSLFGVGILGSILIKFYGVEGMAVANLVGSTLTMLIAYFYMSKK